MLKRILIGQFRGIHELTLDDLGRVNVFIGENGSGKTSILESLFIIAQPVQPGVLGMLGQWREMPNPSSASDDTLRSMFYGTDLERPIQFEFTSEKGLQRLQLLPMRYADAEDVSSPVSETAESATGQLSDLVYGVQSMFWPDEARPDDIYQSRLEVTGAGPTMQHVAKAYQGMGCFYIHARRATSPGETATTLTRLHQMKKGKSFLEAIQAVNPSIKEIMPGFRGGAPIIFVDIGIPEMIPMNVMGDGFCRITLMVTGLMNENAALLVVDEIDSGLHTSVMGKFWKDLSLLSKKLAKQVFCTTHNEEMLQKTIEAFADDPDALRIFRIDRHDDGKTTATKYTYQTFERAENLGLDVR